MAQFLQSLHRIRGSFQGALGVRLFVHLGGPYQRSRGKPFALRSDYIIVSNGTVPLDQVDLCSTSALSKNMWSMTPAFPCRAVVPEAKRRGKKRRKHRKVRMPARRNTNARMTKTLLRNYSCHFVYASGLGQLWPLHASTTYIALRISSLVTTHTALPIQRPRDKNNPRNLYLKWQS